MVNKCIHAGNTCGTCKKASGKENCSSNRNSGNRCINKCGSSVGCKGNMHKEMIYTGTPEVICTGIGRENLHCTTDNQVHIHCKAPEELRKTSYPLKVSKIHPSLGKRDCSDMDVAEPYLKKLRSSNRAFQLSNLWACLSVHRVSQLSNLRACLSVSLQFIFGKIGHSHTLAMWKFLYHRKFVKFFYRTESCTCPNITPNRAKLPLMLIFCQVTSSYHTSS